MRPKSRWLRIWSMCDVSLSVPMPRGSVRLFALRSLGRRREAFPDDMNRTSFEQIFEQYAPRVRAYLLRQGLNPSLADEVVQEVMLTVWHHGDRFDPEKGSVSTWVFTIARNRLIDSIRRQRRPEPSPDDPCWVGGNEDPLASPELAAAHRVRVASLRAALSSLPEEQRRVLEALYFEGQSMSEHAEATGTPLGTVKTRARLALKALRGRIQEGSGE